MLFIRAGIFYLGYCALTLFYGLFIPVFSLLPKKVLQPVLLSWARLILLWLRWCCGIRVRVTGNVASLSESAVIVANHQSAWETFFLQRYFFPAAIVIKRELLSIPLFGWGLKQVEPIVIDRGNPIQSLKKVKQDGVISLRRGKHVVIFPEGTRRPIGQLGEYKRSAADIARQAGVAIIPVAHNSGAHWLNKQLTKLPGCIHLVIGDPIPTEGKNTKVLMEEVHQWTERQLHQIYSNDDRSSDNCSNNI